MLAKNQLDNVGLGYSGRYITSIEIYPWKIVASIEAGADYLAPCPRHGWSPISHDKKEKKLGGALTSRSSKKKYPASNLSQTLPPHLSWCTQTQQSWAPERKRPPEGCAKGRQAMALAMSESRGRTSIGMNKPHPSFLPRVNANAMSVMRRRSRR